MRTSRAILGLLAVGGSVAVALPATAQGPAVGAQQEGAIFQAVVAELARSSEGVLLVDPGVLDGRADLVSIEAGEIGAASRDREQALERMGIGSTAFLADQHCLFAHGLPAPPEVERLTPEQAASRQRCRERALFTSVAIGDTRPDGDSATVKVARMTASSYAVRELVVHRCAAGVWRIIRVRDVLRVQS